MEVKKKKKFYLNTREKVLLRIDPVDQVAYKFKRYKLESEISRMDDH